MRLIIQSAGAGAAIVIHCEVWGLSRKISSRRSGEGAKNSVLCKHGMSGGVSCVCCWYQRSPPSQQLVAKTDEIMISTNWIWNGHQPTQASCLRWLWPQMVWYRWPTATEILSTHSLNPKILDDNRLPFALFGFCQQSLWILWRNVESMKMIIVNSG